MNVRQIKEGIIKKMFQQINQKLFNYIMAESNKRKLNSQRNFPVNQNKKVLTPTIIKLQQCRIQKLDCLNIDQFKLKPKKIIKTLRIQTHSQFEDQGLVNDELNVWVSKFHSSKNLKNATELKQALNQISEHNKQATSIAYEAMRRDEKLAQCLPLTNRPQLKSRNDQLTINLDEVNKLRSKSEKRKVAIEQVYFEACLQSKSSRSLGFRPINSRCPQRLVWNKKAYILKSIKQNKSNQLLQLKLKRNLTFYKDKQTIELKSTIAHQKSQQSIFDYPKSMRNYTSRSRQRKCWQTIGFRQWINKPITKDLHLFSS